MIFIFQENINLECTGRCGINIHLNSHNYQIFFPLIEKYENYTGINMGQQVWKQTGSKKQKHQSFENQRPGKFLVTITNWNLTKCLSSQKL